jgi:hypothetical protein
MSRIHDWRKSPVAEPLTDDQVMAISQRFKELRDAKPRPQFKPGWNVNERMVRHCCAGFQDGRIEWSVPLTTASDIEQAARTYCLKLGKNPDEEIIISGYHEPTHGPLPTKGEAMFDRIAPRWENYEDEVQYLSVMWIAYRDVMNG